MEKIEVVIEREEELKILKLPIRSGASFLQRDFLSTENMCRPTEEEEEIKVRMAKEKEEIWTVLGLIEYSKERELVGTAMNTQDEVLLNQ